MPTTRERRERFAQELGLMTLETAAEQSETPLPLLRRWVRTARIPVFLLGGEVLVCPELVREISQGRDGT